MAKKIRFPLELADGTQARTLEDLQEHFDLESVLSYYKNGKLLTWLRDRYLESEAEAVEALDETAADFQKQFCGIFGAEYKDHSVDLEEIARRQERLAKLRTYTDEVEFIDHIDLVAFDQEDLADLLDDGQKVIYLCGEKFSVPVSQHGVHYTGVNSPVVHLSGKLPKSWEEADIVFQSCNVDNLPETFKEVQEACSTAEKMAAQGISTTISEQAADTCISILSQHELANLDGQLFIETAEYLLFYQLPDESNTTEEGFYYIEKSVGKPERLSIDYEHDFPIIRTWNLRCCVKHNTIYFIENEVDSEERKNTILAAIDLDTKTCTVLPFKISTDRYTRFHLSCSESHLLVYAYQVKDYRDWGNDEDNRPLSKTYLIDLLGGNRCFVLSPNLIVRDAFIFENAVHFFGKKDHKEAASVFRYDIKTQEIRNLFQVDLHTNPFRTYLDSPTLWTPLSNYREDYFFKSVKRIQDNYYFHVRREEESSGIRLSIKVREYYLKINSNVALTASLEGSQLIFFDSYDRRDIRFHRNRLQDKTLVSYNNLDLWFLNGLQSFDHKTQKMSVLSGSDSKYILLGDYLYKYSSAQWHKSNISSGLENLQWEVVFLPDQNT